MYSPYKASKTAIITRIEQQYILVVKRISIGATPHAAQACNPSSSKGCKNRSLPDRTTKKEVEVGQTVSLELGKAIIIDLTRPHSPLQHTSRNLFSFRKGGQSPVLCKLQLLIGILTIDLSYYLCPKKDVISLS